MNKTNKISCFQGLYIRDSVKKKKKVPCSVSDGQKYGGDERKERMEMESFGVAVGENFDHASLSWWQFKCSLSRSR